MTGAREGIDPRYDARFQRGYDGRGVDASPETLARSADPDVAPSAPAVEAVSAERRPADVRSRPSDDEEELDLFGLLEPEPDLAPDAAADEMEDDHAHDGDDLDGTGSSRDAGAEPDPPGRTGVIAPEGKGEPAPDRRTWAWLAAGWSFAAVVTAFGVWLTWVATVDVSWYVASGPTAEDLGMQLLRTLGWSFAPSLLTAGGVGVVVVTVVAVRLTERTVWRPGFAGAFARPAAWWTLIAIAAAGIIAMPGLIAALHEYTVLSSGAGILVDGNGGVIDDTQQAEIDAMARGQFAQAILNPVTLTTVGSVVAIVSLEARRSLRRSHERSTPTA